MGCDVCAEREVTAEMKRGEAGEQTAAKTTAGFRQNTLWVN